MMREQGRLKLGLKIYMTNQAYIAPALAHLEKGVCDFVEIAVDVCQEASDLDRCRVFSGRAVVHAPHSYAGLNPADPEAFAVNVRIVEKVESARKALGADKVIFHPGIIGELKETIRQFKAYFREQPGLASHVLIENKPGIGLRGEICCGSTLEDIRRLQGELGVGFCLDFGHAICAAAGEGHEWPAVVEGFLKLDPAHFHLYDGWSGKVTDTHLHLGQGDYDIARILRFIPDGASVTIEAPHDQSDSLDDFIFDVRFLRERGA